MSKVMNSIDTGLGGAVEMFIDIPSTANLTQSGNPSSESLVAAVLGVLPQANVAEVRSKLQQYKNDINRVIIDMMPQETAVFGGGVTKTSESSVTTSQTRRCSTAADLGTNGNRAI